MCGSGMCGGPSTGGSRARTMCDPHGQKCVFRLRFGIFGRNPLPNWEDSSPISSPPGESSHPYREDAREHCQRARKCKVGRARAPQADTALRCPRTATESCELDWRNIGRRAGLLRRTGGLARLLRLVSARHYSREVADAGSRPPAADRSNRSRRRAEPCATLHTI